MFMVMTDGACLCKSCAQENRKQIFRSTGENDRDGWAAAGVDVNWEDAELYCDHCGDRIESAYAEPENEQPLYEADVDGLSGYENL